MLQPQASFELLPEPETVYVACREKPKGKAAVAAAAAAAGKQADLFRQMMRPRLPPVSFFVEQMAEGVLKPETWAAMDDPADQETDDEEAEEFQHMWVACFLWCAWASKGNVVACRGHDQKIDVAEAEEFQHPVGGLDFLECA